ncbi:NADH-cytochrome b5 reductase [Entomortierella chlamydospora]|uniref:NADH-cytochrome b5 reductase n=1 Tax=Entomortierella chlamydospora TaxID=101097 RepID=A0A9P6MRK6_9FUNG|nr:NADH-cytochrome b5 reductase [Entomortierella chlamydospora]
MTLTNASIAAASGILIAGAYMVEPTSIPFVAAGVAATWVHRLVKKKGPRTPPLDPKEYRRFILVDKVVASPNTAMYKFALPHEDDVLNLPIGQHISVMANIGGKEISRSYTPTSSSDDIGHFVLLIKIIRAIVKNPEDKTKVNLIFANVAETDILLKAELDELSAKHPQFKVHYVLNNPPEGWTGGVGFVNAEMIKEHIPAPSGDIKVLLCGPPPMITAMSKITQELGYDKVNAVSKLPDQVFKF